MSVLESTYFPIPDKHTFAEATDGNVYIVHCNGLILQYNVQTKKCEIFERLMAV